VSQFLDGKVTLYAGDCLDVLATLPENSVDSVVCDPPYHLTSIVKRFGNSDPEDVEKNATARKIAGQGTSPHGRAAAGFMGKQWDGGDVAFQVDTWRKVLRVLKPGGYIVAFASSRGFGRMSVAIEDAGFITHPLIAWVFGSGFPKATRIKADGFDGFRYGGQALKPAIEPIYMGQKPFERGISGTENIRKWGAGAVNIDGCRIDVTGQRPYEIQSWEQDQLLCDSCAALAEKNAKHSIPVIRASIATKPAAQTLSARGKSSQADTDRTDTGCSAGMRAADTCTSSSTSKSGKTPTDQCPPDSRFITETKTEATTTSTTCCSCQRPITGGFISGNTQAATKSLPLDGNRPAPIGRDGEPSAHRRYTDEGSTNFAATPGPRGGSPLGRWPANLIHDGSAEVIAAFPEADGAVSNGKKAGTGFGNGYGVKPQAPSFADSGSAARFFYAVEKEERCDLCRVLLSGKDAKDSPCDANTAELTSPTQSTPNGATVRDGAAVSPPLGSAGKKQPSNGHAIIAESRSFQCHQTRGSFAPSDALTQEASRIAPHVRSAASLCASCETDIAQSLAATRLGLDPASLPCLESMPARRRQILLQHLALYVAGRESTDTITTTASLKTLFGSVLHAIADTTSLVRPEGPESTESARRLFYSSKADAEDRLGSKHPTVKPLDLMQYLVRLVTPPGGLVLDPFAGTGTTGEAAWREGMRAVLIEREPEYQADIARRMDLAANPTKRAAVAKSKNNLQGAEGTPLFGGEAA